MPGWYCKVIIACLGDISDTGPIVLTYVYMYVDKNDDGGDLADTR